MYVALTREGANGVKFEADAILRQLEGADAHFGKQVVKFLCNLQRKRDKDSSSPVIMCIYAMH